MQGLRRAESLRPGQRARYCRRCGAPLALAPGAMGGVRCSNCGLMPGIPVQTLADLLPSKAPSQLTAVPMQVEPKPGLPARRKDVAVSKPRSDAQAPRSGVVAGRRPAASQALKHESALSLLGRGGHWAEDLPQPSARAWITGAAAAIAIGIALVVALALG